MGKALAGVALVGEVDVVVVDSAQVRAALFVEDYVVEPYAVALGVDVEFADGVGLVAGVAKGLREGRDPWHGLGGLEDAVAVGPGCSAGHQGAAGGNAHGAFGVGVGVAGAAAGEGVEGWSLD